jgi:hypothetical protein
MRDKARRLACLLVLGVCALGGCQRINFEKETDIDPGGTKAWDFTAPQYEQKVLVTINPTGGAVSAYLCKEDDRPRVEMALMANKAPPASVVLGGRESKDKAESYSFEATIPAKTPYSLVVATSKRDAKVKVKLVGR